jgi:hypothetical protein
VEVKMYVSNQCGRVGLALVAALSMVALGGSAHAAGLIDLARTGQTTSYAAGDDGDLQAGVAWPTPRFIANPDGTLTDALTGLVWLGDANCADSAGYDPDGRGDGSMDWLSALAFVTNINTTAGFISACSYTGSDSDWRLPNFVEIESLVNAGLVDQSAWLSGEGFSQVQSGRYWTATTPSLENDLLAFGLDTSDGSIGRFNKTSTFNWAWPVRAGSDGTPDPSYPGNLWKVGSGGGGHGVAWPAFRLVDNGDGTVTDELTGLMWLKDVGCLDATSWPNALALVSDFNLPVPTGGYECADYDNGTHEDWRLPNRKEVFSLIDNDSTRPALVAGDPFANVAPFSVPTTSTTDAASSSEIWLVPTWIFSGVDQGGKDAYAIWLVRTPTPRVPTLSDWWQAALMLAIALLGAAAISTRARRGRAST